jgi:opacity protein-like surface antigen
MKRFFLLISLIVSLAVVSFAQDVKDKVKISGLMFGDYSYNITNVDGNQINMNGFQFRRIYFTTDYAVADDFDARFRLESDQSSNSNTAGGKLGVMVKDAYLKWKGVFTGSDMIFGLSPTPAYDISEAAWGYRSLEKTIMDLNGIVSSRDLGIDLKGKITDNATVNYWVKIGNNNSNAPENNKYKRYYALLQFKPIEGFQATIYGDYAAQPVIKDTTVKSFKENNAFVGALFLNYQMKNDFAVGFEGFTRTMQNNFYSAKKTPLADQSSLGLSFWAWVSVSEKLRLVARYDSYDPNTDKDNDAASLLIAGIDYKVAKNVSIIPNIELSTPQKAANTNGSTDSSNLTGRVTFAFTF